MVLKIIKILGVSVALVSCGVIGVVPKVEASGGYFQLYVGGDIVMQTNYESEYLCGIVANNTDGYTNQTRVALIDGAMKVMCSPSSKEDNLGFKAIMRDIITNKSYETNVISAEVCRMIAADKSTPRFVYACL